MPLLFLFTPNHLFPELWQTPNLHSHLICLEESLYFTKYDPRRGSASRQALTPKLIIQQVLCYRTPSEHLEAATTGAKGGIPALCPASHSGKLDMPVLQGQAWMPGSFQVLSIPQVDSESSENSRLTELAHPQPCHRAADKAKYNG